MEVTHNQPRVLRALGFLILFSLSCTAAVAQEQTVSGAMSLSELRVGQSTDLTLSYSATDNAKTSGLGLRLHFDSSALEMGTTSDKLRESAQPFQIQSDTSDFDNNPATDKFFLTSWADFSGVGWPDIAAQPVTLYVVPLTAKSDFAGEMLAFSGYSAPGYTLVAADITIVKAEVPVITLLGNAEVSLELGSTYTDAGATAADNIDGVITANIVTVNPVDVNTVGTYAVTYNASDAAGNAALQVSRTVTITPDATIPAITLLGKAEVSLELGSTYTDAGATAVDNIDGDLTANIAVVSTVDVNTVGTYTVTYNVSDAAGNAATQVTRTVTITPDATIPAITLLGETEVSLELGSIYTDAGATAVDNIDGVITSSIAVVSTVDVDTVGTYTVTYNVSDAAGNAALQVSRTVTITPDATIPAITLLGETEVSLELGSIYTDAGATAVDNIDGVITSSIAVVSTVDVNTVGTYTVTYNVSDAAGNAALQVSRTVTITPDVTIPSISLLGDAEVSLELGSTYTDAGGTASDNIDGDITSSIVMVNPVDVNSVGTYTVTYNVSDAAGNAALQVSRTVTITPDVTIPSISLLGDAEVSLELGSTYTDAGGTASDNIDGDITSSIVMVNPVDVNSVGTYTVTYNVSDAAGNAALQVSRTVTITPDATIPAITLLGETEVSLELGSTYTDTGATAVDNIDGDLTSSIVTDNNVDVDTVGTYTVTYDVSDAAGNAAVQVSRTVNITPDATIPIITLLGETEVSLELGSIYTDAGATAVDNIDGVITSSIAVVSTVDVDTVGTYTVTYNVSDAAGNAAVQVLRTVEVGGIIDVDGNGQYDALTDGLLVLRSMFGLDGSALISGTVASNATFTSATDIEAQIQNLGILVDIDGNGQIDALTDGLLILRYLFGLEGDVLIAGVVAQNATRVTAAEIEAHLAGLTPAQ